MSTERRGLERAGHDARTTIEAALRDDCSPSATPKTRSYVPARVLNMVVLVDERVERRDRQPPARRRALRTPRA